MGDVSYTVIEGEEARRADELLNLCNLLFPGFEERYLTGRLPRVTDPAIHVARMGNGDLAGFKLGYRRGETFCYSWLGGVHPEARGRGIARQLMAAQHEWATSRRYRTIETRTRARNNMMIVLNLRAGFEIVGFETDASGIGVVTQRKMLVVA